MDKIPRMNRLMRRQLVLLGRRTGDPPTAMRFLAVARLGLGHSSVRVANDLDVARSTVVRTATRFATDGPVGLHDQRRHNGKAKVDERFRRRVVQLLQRTPQDFGWMRPTWTRELLCLQMQRDGHVAIAACTMGRVLAKIGARLGMPKPVVLCPWPRDERLRVLAQIRRLEGRASAAEPVLYSDEVDIHLNPKIGRDWMLRGQQRRVVTPGKNKKFYLAGALDGPPSYDRRGPQECLVVLRPAPAARIDVSRRPPRARRARQLRHPPRQAHEADACRARRSHRAALPSAVLSRHEPHRACLAGTARERDAQPSLQDAPGTTDELPPIRRELPLAHRGDAGAVIGRSMIDGRGSRSVI